MTQYTEWEVVRVGDTVVLSVFVDAPPPGAKMQLTFPCETRAQAEMHEHMLKHLIACAQMYQYMPEAALQGTVQLTKGLDE